MKYKYIGSFPSVFEGKIISSKEGENIIETDKEMNTSQFEKVVTPKKVKKNNK